MSIKKKIEKLLIRWKAKVDALPLESVMLSHQSGVYLGLGLALGVFQEQEPQWQDQPTKDGYYWFKSDDEIEIVKVYRAKYKPGNFIVNFLYTSDDFIASHLDGKWYGPITPPKEE